MVTLTTAPLDVAALEAAVADPHCGALVSFVGVVRNHHRGRAVDHLEYEAYEPMAVAQIEAIVARARERWPLGPVRVAHRMGRLEIGDAAVVVVVASAHRAAAFEACAAIMDQIKDHVPIWKRESWQDGTEEWVGPDQ